MSPQTPRKRGRPPAGHDGEKVSKYPQLTVRLPVGTKSKLTTLSLLMNAPIWRIIDDAIETYVKNLPAAEQKLLGSIAERLANGDWPVTSHWQAMWPANPAGAPPARRTRREPPAPKRSRA